MSTHGEAEYYRNKRVLVTGGAGFIGSNLIRRLVELGAQVVTVDALIAETGALESNLAEVRDRILFRRGDLRELGLMEALVEPSQVVFNLAGRSSHIDSMREPLGDMASNVHGQAILLEAVRRVNPKARVVYASTRQMYGKPLYRPVDEKHPIHPVDVNGINKAAGEGYHTLYRSVYGLETVSLRLTNTFGPRMRVRDARQNFLGIWIRRVVENEGFEIWGGQQKRDLTYIDDVVDALLAAAADPLPAEAVYNVGGTPPVSLSELGELLVKVAGSGRIEYRAFPPERLRIDMGDYWTDDRLFRQATGWEPKVSLAEGLKRTVDFYREHREAYV